MHDAMELLGWPGYMFVEQCALLMLMPVLAVADLLKGLKSTFNARVEIKHYITNLWWRSEESTAGAGFKAGDLPDFIGWVCILSACWL